MKHLLLIFTALPALAADLALPSGATLHYGSAKIETGESTPRLQRGEALLASAKGFLGAKSQRLMAGSCQVDCSGGALIKSQADQSTTITCVTGHVTVSLPGQRGAFAEIRPGQFLLVPSSATSMPSPATTRLSTLIETHSLLAKSPIAADVAKAANKQEQAIAKGKLLISKVTLQGNRAQVASSGGGADASAASSSSGGSSSSSSSGATSSGGGTTVAAAAAGGGHACA